MLRELLKRIQTLKRNIGGHRLRSKIIDLYASRSGMVPRGAAGHR